MHSQKLSSLQCRRTRLCATRPPWTPCPPVQQQRTMCQWAAGLLARPSQWWSTWNKVTTPSALTDKTLVFLLPTEPSVSLSSSAGDRAAGCLPGSGVPTSPEDHHPPGEGLRAAALCGQVSHKSKSNPGLIDLKIQHIYTVGLV